MIFLTKYKYASAYIAAFLLQMWFDISAYAASNKIYFLGLLINFTYPLVAMVPMMLILEEKTRSNRMKIALMEGTGYASAFILFVIVRDWNSLKILLMP